MRALRSPAISERASIAERPPKAVAQSAHSHQRRHAHRNRQHHECRTCRAPTSNPASRLQPPAFPAQRPLSHLSLASDDSSVVEHRRRTEAYLPRPVHPSARFCDRPACHFGSCVTSTSVVPARLFARAGGRVPSVRWSNRGFLSARRPSLSADSVTKARASATRCCSPPESCTG